MTGEHLGSCRVFYAEGVCTCGVTGETPNPLDVLREYLDTVEYATEEWRTADAAFAQVVALADWAHEALATLRDLGCQDAPFVCEFITNDEGCAVCELLQREAALVPFAALGNTNHARGCAACDGDPEAHARHVCGRED